MRSWWSSLCLLPLLALGQPPEGYYAPAGGLSGEALREALHEIISPHTVLANSTIWAAFELTDSRPDGTVWDMYSDVPGGVPAYVFQFVTDQCGNYDEEGDCFNREHTFPQSWYGNSAPMSTDLFHLYPADAWVNQQRGNLPYGTVGAVDWTGSNGSVRGDCNWPGCSGTVFEPIDAYKGDLARGYFYMLTRYLPDLAGWSSPMMSGGNFLPWAESMLLDWHASDPVSSKEQERNNTVFAIQGNRNPFIDHPEWVASIWGPLATVAEEGAGAFRLWSNDGVLHAELPEVGMDHEITIHDAAGRVVWQEPVRGQRMTLVLDLVAGLYVATLRGPTMVRSLRFVH